MIRQPVVIAVILSLAVCLGAEACGAEQLETSGSFDVWSKHREALRRDPSVVRCYTFEGLSPGGSEVPSMAGKGGGLRLASARPGGGRPEFTLVEGRWPQKKAVRLDREFLAGEPFPVEGRALTVTAWIKANGQGAIRGDSVIGGGTLLSSGNGYWEGWRVTLKYPERIVGFEIGRPQPSHSVGIGSGPEIDREWRHLAAVWDGRAMRTYLDGILAAAGEYAGDYTPPAKGGQFRIGFANAGWGSVVLDVDEVVVYRRPLSAAEVLRDAHFYAPLPEPIATTADAAQRKADSKDFAAAAKEWAKATQTGDLVPDYRAAARLALVRLHEREKNSSQAAAEAAAVVGAAGVRAAHRKTALHALVRLMREAGVVPPAEALEPLLGEADLTPTDRVMITLQLARRARSAGDLAAARKLYGAMAAMTEASPRQRLDARLEFGHACLGAKDFATARTLYAAVLAASDAPPPYRALAQLQIAASYVREKDLLAARAEYARLAAMTDVLPHHRREAQERLREVERLQAGLPARDPARSRVQLAKRPAAAVTLYVAPGGNDADTGAEARPLATPERARDMLRQLRRQGKLPAGGAAVVFRGGRYARKETLKFSAEDGGTAESPIVYRNAPGETAVLSGGQRIAGFKPVEDAAILARLPEESRGKVFQCDLKAQGIRDYGVLGPRGFGRGASPALDLYFDGKPMTVARWPNEGFVRVAKVIDPGGKPGGAAVFEYEGDRPSRWRHARDAWLFGYWKYLWADGTLAVASADPAARRIKTAQPYTYGGGIEAGAPYHAFNLLEEIDRPGEWYLDRAAGILYFYPPGDPARAVIEVPMLSAPLARIVGATCLTLQGLVFELGRSEGIVVEGGDHGLLAGCVVRRIGGDAVTIQGGSSHGVLSCDLHTLGRGGMRVQGGDRKTLAPSGHFAENCHVWDFSRVDRTYTPAIWTDGVGTRIAHNRFHGSSCHAGRLEGNDHLVEFNEVFDVVQESDDQGGMEMFGNPTYRGVVFRYNYYHDIGGRYDWHCGQAGIRLDDAICGVLIYGNIFRRCSTALFGGVQIHGGKENVVENNLFADCRYAVSFSGWGPQRWKEFLKNEHVAGQLKAVDAGRPPYSARYPALARLDEGPDVNHVWRNLVFRCGGFLARDRGIQDLAANGLTTDDPGFLDAAAGDFRLHGGAAGWESLGLCPIPFEEIGLYDDEYRQSAPIAGKK